MSSETITYRLIDPRLPLTFSVGGKTWMLSVMKLPGTHCWRAQMSAGSEQIFVESGYTASDLERRLSIAGVPVRAGSTLDELFRDLESTGLAEKLPSR